ncbi:PHD-zinc-finger like domain-containing protein, partial [Dimargaris cristalligena]
SDPLSPFKRPEGHYIRNVELTETELAAKVEYDMDEEDQAWLDLVNLERSRADLNLVPASLCEALLDRLEKEWFDLTKHIQRSLAEKQHAELPPEESACSICGEEECENSNAIVFCDGCNLAVHQDCYGVPYIPEGQWLCRRCMISPETRVTCLFCPYTDGAFKKTTTNKWAHLLCALWIPEVTVANPVYMEPIDNVDQVPKSRWRLHCYICKRRQGACIQCTNKACYTAYHVTCARKARLYLKMKTHKYTGEPIFRSFCDRHAPPDHLDVYDPAHATAALRASDAELALQTQRIDAVEALFRPRTTHHPSSSHSDGPASPSFQHYNALAPVIPEYIARRLLDPALKPPIRQRAAFIQQLARYWSLKRQSRRGAPLIKRLHLEPWTASASQQKAAELESDRQYGILQHVRKDLERIRNLVELVRKRERQKLKRFRLQRQYLEGFIYPLSRVLWPVLEALQAADKRDYFAEPVPVQLAPDYYDVITNPMDLGTIQRRLASYAYDSLDAFERDAQLVFTNATVYNRPTTPYYRTAVTLRALLGELMAAAR